MDSEMNVLVDPDDAAEILSVPVTTLEGWRRRSVGPNWLKLGPKKIRYRRQELLDWLRTCERSGSPMDVAPMSRAG